MKIQGINSGIEYYISVIAFVAGITLGPNNMMLLASGLNHGIQKSIPHYLWYLLMIEEETLRHRSSETSGE